MRRRILVMCAAYFYQIVNISVAVLMVPLLLQFLDVNGFVIWSIFTTFGGITLQLESAIQIVSAREIAKEYHAKNPAAMQVVVRKAKRAYAILSASMLGPFLLIGVLYLNYIASKTLEGRWNLEWTLFVAAYAVNYYFGINNSIQLGMERIGIYNNINSISRTFNFVTTYALLKFGLSVIGICISFVSSVAVGCVLRYLSAKKTLAEFYSTLKGVADESSVMPHGESRNLILYTIYTVVAFIVYKGSLLVAAALFPKQVVGAYGLTLQAYTILSAFALVPTQVWLTRLVSAVVSGNKQKTMAELIITILTVNGIFIFGMTVLVLFGDTLLVLIGSKIMLLGMKSLMVAGIAFLSELNIFVLASFLVLKSKFKFVFTYVISGTIGATIGVVLTVIEKASVVTLILVPLLTQTLVSLPVMFRLMCEELDCTPMRFLHAIGRVIVRRDVRDDW